MALSSSAYYPPALAAPPATDSDGIDKDIEKQQLLHSRGNGRLDGGDYNNDRVATQSGNMSQSSIIVEIPDFVPSWEGIRGVAVWMVCIAHVLKMSVPFMVTMGKGGVTIFFILSGFLITGILQKQQAKLQRVGERFHHRHLLGFYMDRSVRLYPALVVMLLVTALFERMLQGPVHENILGHMAASLFYVSNITQSVMVPHNIWNNTWSLGVEEQFYIFWSLLLPTLFVFGRRTRSGFVLGLLLTSWLIAAGQESGKMAWSWWFMNSGPLFNFWKMWIGVYLRLSPQHVPAWLRRPATAWYGLALLVLVHVWHLPDDPWTLGHLGFDKQFFSWSVWHDTFVAAAAVMMILGSMDRGNALFDTQLLRFSGRVSYAFYLYQSPMTMVYDQDAKYAKGHDGFSRSCIAFLIAMISTIYIEEPIRARYRKWKTSSHVTSTQMRERDGAMAAQRSASLPVANLHRSLQELLGES